MSEKRFKIVFDGALLPGVEITTAKLNLAELFKCDVSAIERLFSGEPVALKHNLSQADAHTYLTALAKTGVDARIEAEPSIELDLSEVKPVTAPLPEADTSPYAPPRAPVGEVNTTFSELKVFSVQGRIGRLRYLAWSLAALLIMGGVAGTVGLGLLASDNMVLAAIVCVVGLLAYFYVNITISVQRLHDLGWSGWLWLLNFVPIVGSIFPLVLMVSPGSNVANRYGAPPPPNTTAVKVLSWMWVVLIVALIVGMVAGGLSSLEDRYSETSYSESVDSGSVDEDAEPADSAAAPVESEQE